MERKSCVVIGAGITGLVAGRRLRELGHDFVIYDKGRAPGGRASSRDRRPSSPFDHGAQYFTARKEAFADLLQFYRQRGSVSVWSPTVGQREQGSLSAAEEGAGRTRWVGVPTMRQWTLDLAEGVPVMSSVHVGAIERAGNGLRLVDREGHTIVEADVVGVSAPGPQTARLVDSVDPELATRIGEVAFAPTWSLLVELPAATALPFEMLFVNDAGPLRIVVDDSSKPGRPAGPRVVAHATEAWSRAHLEDAPDVVMSVLLEALFEALGIEPVAPVTSSVHRWRFATPSPPEGGEPCWSSRVAPLVCAGDWTVAPRVEGAYEAGVALAEALAERLR